MNTNKIYQPQQITVRRSEISLADYNPRTISDDARKKLKKNLTTVGLLGGIVWNSRTGNIVSGHQRVSIMDSVNRYNPETKEGDYEFRVEVVDMDSVTEKQQNLFMNNRNVQGDFDDDLLRKMLADIDYREAGFEPLDMEILGLSDFNPDDALPAMDEEFNVVSFADSDDLATEDEHADPTEQEPVSASASDQWKKASVIEKDEELAKVDSESYESEENKTIDRSTDFYEDTPENQIARHNEVRKIKERILNENGTDKDGGMLSYVVVSFATYDEKTRFMASFGYDANAKYINGVEFMNRIEFGIEEDGE